MSIDYLDIRDFGASTSAADNAPAIQAALEQCRIANAPGIIVPVGTFKTSRLTWKYQPIIGYGRYMSVLQGLPGQDVLYAADYSIGEPGSVLRALATYLRGLQLQVDGSVANSFPNRTLYPVVGAWAPGIAVSVADYYVNSLGQVYLAKTAGTTGAAEPTHTQGRASDGGVTWLYIDAQQRMIANCALALPWYDASNGGNQCYIDVDDVLVQGIGSGAAQTGAVWSQQEFYQGRFRNFYVRQTYYGLVNPPPSMNFNGAAFGSDQMSMQDGEMNGVTFPFVLYNPAAAMFRNFNLASASLGDRTYLLLPARVGGRSACFNNTFHGCGAESGGGGHTNPPIYQAILTGVGTWWYGGSFCGNGARGDTKVCWDADSGGALGVVMPLGDNGFEVWGSYNDFRSFTGDSPTQAYLDQGVGNSLTYTNPVTAPFYSERPLQVANRARAPLFAQDDSFIQRGLVATPFPNLSDLFVGAREVNWQGSGASPQGTKQLFSDNTLETGGYVRILTPVTTQWNVNRALGQVLSGFPIGRIPPCAHRLYIKARVGTAGNERIRLYLNGSGGGTIGGSPDVTFQMTTQWAVYSMDVDFSNLPTTQLIQFVIYPPPGADSAQYIDIAWIAFRPIQQEALFPDPSGAGLCRLFADAGGLKIAFANGTVKQIAPYP